MLLFIGIGRFRSQKQEEGGGFIKMIGSVLFIVLSSLWLIIHSALFISSYSDISRFIDLCRTGKCGIAEGNVHVSKVQPFHGHSGGDRISIGGQNFVIDYFFATPGYNQSIEHDGVLREGVYARVRHAGGVILKVEVRTNRK